MMLEHMNKLAGRKSAAASDSTSAQDRAQLELCMQVLPDAKTSAVARS